MCNARVELKLNSNLKCKHVGVFSCAKASFILESRQLQSSHLLATDSLAPAASMTRRTGQARSKRKDAAAIPHSAPPPTLDHPAQPIPGLSVRITALKKTAKGGPSFSLIMDDITKQRHKRNPYSEKYLQLCLSSFAQVLRILYHFSKEHPVLQEQGASLLAVKLGTA